MANPKKKNTSRQKEEKYAFPLLLPIIMILAVIPLIVYMYSYNTHLRDFDWYTSYTETTDFFLFFKMAWAVGTCIFMLFCMVYLFLAEEKKIVWVKNLIPLAVYCGISLISAIASKYSYFSFHGIYEQFEPVWMLLGYGVITYYCFYILRTESAVRQTLRWFIAGILVMCALGLSQVFSHDFFRTSLGQKVMTPQSYTGEVNFTFELGRPYLSLYNPNYVGFYAALTVPLLAALLFTTKKIWVRAGYGAIIAVLLLILFASQSRAGILALIASFFLMLLCMRKVFLKNWKIAIAAVIVAIAAFLGVNALNGNVLLTRLQGMFSFTPEQHALEYIETNDDNVTVRYSGNTLIFQTTQTKEGTDAFRLTDGDGKPVDFSLGADGVNYTVNDSRFPFSFCSSRAENFSGFVVNIPTNPADPVNTGNNWFFTNLMKSGDSTYYVMGGAGALMKLTQQEKTWSFLENHYSFANKRGYIWARTLPLLKKYFLLGSGPDTFIIAFPNHDLVGLCNSGHLNEIITKPHCMYLQVAVQTGIPSLIALLVFFGWYLVSSIKLYWNNSYKDYLSLVGVGIFACVTGYLILALTNDSCVAVSPIFYGIIGMGLGVNYSVKASLSAAPAANNKKPAAEQAGPDSKAGKKKQKKR